MGRDHCKHRSKEYLDWCKNQKSCYDDKRPHVEPPKKHESKKDVLVVEQDILDNTVWSGVIKISAEVHVRAPAVLTIEPHSVVLFKECRLCNVAPGALPFATLVVDSGASIDASDVEFRSALGGLQATGGLIILGTQTDFTFEDYQTVQSDPNIQPGHSSLSCVAFNNLGENGSDINALTLAALTGVNELQLSNISVDNGGDDGLQIFCSPSLYVNRLTSNDSYDNGLDLDGGSNLTVTESLNIRGRWVYPIANNCPSLPAKGPGLIEVVGGAASNSVSLVDGATYYLLGRITDKVVGSYVWGGAWGGFTAGDVLFETGVGPASVSATFP